MCDIVATQVMFGFNPDENLKISSCSFHIMTCNKALLQSFDFELSVL